MQTVASFDTLRPWQSDAGGAPRLRGRRHEHGGTTLHFVHGNGFSGGTYWPLLQQFVGDYGLFCHDLEGHGASDAPQRSAGPRGHAARIAAVIAEQGLDRRPLIGLAHSYGAALSVRVAAQHPQYFRALVLLDPILMPPQLYWLTRLLALTGGNPMSRAARRRRTRWPSRQAAYERLHDRGIYRGWNDAAFAAFIDSATRDDEHGERVLCCPSWLEASIFDHPVYPWRALRRLRCPVLILHGDRSYPFVAGAARRAKRLQAAIEVESMAGGHCFMQEDPAASAAAIRAFLQRHAL